jgi:hypothetical protein
LDDREGELARVLDEGDDVAQGQLPGGHAKASDDRNRHVVEVGDEVQRRLDDPGDELRPVAGVVQPVVLGLEGLDRAVLASERLDDGMARVHLLYVAVEGAGRCPLRHELFLGTGGNEDGHDDRQGHREE